jgi:hypothetical protein
LNSTITTSLYNLSILAGHRLLINLIARIHHRHLDRLGKLQEANGLDLATNSRLLHLAKKKMLDTTKMKGMMVPNMK